MFPDKPYAPSVGSFQRPVTPPDADPDQSPLVYVGFNRIWLDYILGALKQLLLQATWKVATSDELDLAQSRAFELLYLFSTYISTAPVLGSAGADTEDIPMIRQDPDNPCLLQTSIDGVTWCTFADFSKCLPAVGQTGAGAPQPTPGGGTQNYCQELSANAKLLLPTVVNSGDTIHVVSQTGAGNDGDIITWYCPDGSYFFAGACIPGTFDTDSDDPMPSENHMSLIALIDGTYYSLEHGYITVPGGVTNAPVTIQVNDDNLVNNSGSYQVCVNVTNNAAASWSHTFDFALSTGGWVKAVDRVNPLWVAGTGWTAADDTDGGGANNYRRVWIKRSFTATQITGYEVIYNYTYGGQQFTGDYSELIRMDLLAVNTDLKATFFPTKPTDGAHDEPFTFSPSNQDNISLLITCNDAPAGGYIPGGAVTVSKVIVTGLGTDPF